MLDIIFGIIGVILVIFLAFVVYVFVGGLMSSILEDKATCSWMLLWPVKIIKRAIKESKGEKKNEETCD